MNFRTISAVLTGLLAITQFSATAHAALAEKCFKSNYDYELYLKYGDETPPDPDDVETKSQEEYEILEDAHFHGAARKKGITINVDHTTSGGKIISNASRSSTPSGEKRYVWGSNMPSTTGEYTSNAGAPGTYRNIQLTVTDPVCQIEESTQVRIYSQ
ncbi:hypothetical protein [Pseudomonas sp. zfem002]|uniref:hypothetical protein n=1 Tax=Pseudomonas sp. zfem002 TaxID=3078197 RepID=UPI00292A0F1D|nr:hypothetical protein [Pseudomonas sp. zfem002]MDU9392780.1 hypothetical protein [Pseudomonas sp. zfem002]